MSGATVSGPFFEPGAAEVLGHTFEAAEQDIADRTYDLVQHYLAGSLQHPTGRYQSAVHVEATAEGHDVTDGGVVYGPWLEGVGSRNSTTRFKGYASFRRAMQEAEPMSHEVAEVAAAEVCRRLS